MDELCEDRHPAGAMLSADDQSRSCVLAVQRPLLDDPRASDRWLRQCLLGYLQEGVLRGQLRNATTVSVRRTVLKIIPVTYTVRQWVRT